MRPLYEIKQEILDCVDQESGEILDSDRLDALEMEKDLKIEGVALWVKDLKAEADAVKAEADKLNTRKKALDNKIESIKAWLLYALDGGKLTTPRCKVYQTHSQRVSITDENVLCNFINSLERPDTYLRFKEPELNKDAIKKALKDGAVIPGAALEETESVVIK